ncbi:unnamed protein product [Dicrocoelium dendriticum]|nr:unnamed protein product [Dicrocoelium dendriticum]
MYKLKDHFSGCNNEIPQTVSFDAAEEMYFQRYLESMNFLRTEQQRVKFYNILVKYLQLRGLVKRPGEAHRSQCLTAISPARCFPNTIRRNGDLDEEGFTKEAHRLRLYGYPYLVKYLRQILVVRNEQKASRLHYLRQRRAFSEAERQLARLKLRLKEETKQRRMTKESETKQSVNTTRSQATQTIKDSSQHMDNKANSTPTRQCTGLSLSEVEVYHDAVSIAHTDSYGSDDTEVLGAWQRLVRQLRVPLPALCFCIRPDPSDSSTPPWLTCTRECRFFRNPETYLKELLDYVHSLE